MILALNINKNQQDINKNTALHLLLQNPLDYQKIETLLEWWLNPNILNDQDKNIITHMIETSDYALLEVLKPYRLDMNQVLNSLPNKPSIFLFAVEKWDVAFLSSILTYKNLFEIDTEKKDTLWNNALHLSIQANYYELTKLLLAQQIPLNESNNEGLTPLMNATIRNQFNIAHLLASHVWIDFEKINENNMNVLDYACQNNALNIVILFQNIHKNFSQTSCK